MNLPPETLRFLRGVWESYGATGMREGDTCPACGNRYEDRDGLGALGVTEVKPGMKLLTIICSRCTGLAEEGYSETIAQLIRLCLERELAAGHHVPAAQLSRTGEA